jgi:hypothetical protein
MRWRLRSLRNRLVRYLRIKRFVWHTALLSIIFDLRQWRAKRPVSRLNIRIIRVSDRKVVRIR